MIYKNDHPLLEYIRSRPAIAHSKLGIAPSTMSLFLSGKKNFSNNSTLIWPLTMALINYGLQIGEWRFWKVEGDGSRPVIGADRPSEDVYYFRVVFLNDAELKKFFDKLTTTENG